MRTIAIAGAFFGAMAIGILGGGAGLIIAYGVTSCPLITLGPDEKDGFQWRERVRVCLELQYERDAIKTAAQWRRTPQTVAAQKSSRWYPAR